MLQTAGIKPKFYMSSQHAVWQIVNSVSEELAGSIFSTMRQCWMRHIHQWIMHPTRASPRHLIAPGRLIIWLPGQANILRFLKTGYSLNSFDKGQGWRAFLTARAEIADNFLKNFWKPDYLHHISYYSSDVLPPLVGCRPGQLTEWLSP